MKLLRANDWSKINEAYQIFIHTGQIIPGVLRPEVERSWQRSRSVNPWTSRPEPMADEEYNQIMSENSKLVEFAMPVLQYMYATNTHEYEDNLVHLTDKTGVVLRFVTRVCSFPSPLKKKLTETTIGTSNTGTALVEQVPVELGGPEIYKVCYQSMFGGAAPVKDNNNNLIGVITFYNNYGKIPEQPLDFVIAAAELIEDMLKNPNFARQNQLECNPYFTKMIDYIKEYILVINKKDQIVNANNSCSELLGLDRNKLIGRYCDEFGIILDKLISESAYVNKDYFTLTTQDQQQYTCLLQNNKTIQWLNGQEHTLLSFSLLDSPKVRPKAVAMKESINTFEKIIGKSPEHHKMISIAQRSAKVHANVLLDGETGTGKDVIANAIHNASSRSRKPFISINCGSIPKEILQSELFGYEEGTFTGGKKGGQIGKFEAANGGTVFLDEIGEMPLAMQVSLLRFLQDKTIVRVGGYQTKRVDVRIIAATNRELPKQVAEGLFREDLYYRLKVIHITLPPLRDRAEDVLLIADYYIDYFSNLYGLENRTLTQETKDILYRYNWPGNIRELANAIENAVVFSDEERITPDLLPLEILEYQSSLFRDNSKKIAMQEKEIIARALYVAKGNVSQAAKSIGISRNTLYRKIDKYGLNCLK